MDYYGPDEGDGYDHPDGEPVPWEQSYSGLIFAKLEELGKKEHKTVSVRNKDGPYEVFVFGTEEAGLVIHWNGGLSPDGKITHQFIECWEYKRYPWWRAAIEAADFVYGFHDVAVLHVAIDTGIKENRELFNPKTVVEKFGLSSSQDFVEKIAVRQWVTDKITELLLPYVHSDYKFEVMDNALRAIPISDGAKKSRTEDNDTYQKLVDAVKTVGLVLPEEYRKQARAIVGKPDWLTEYHKQKTDEFLRKIYGNHN
jgi:hypothetical protein